MGVDFYLWKEYGKVEGVEGCKATISMANTTTAIVMTTKVIAGMRQY